MQGFMDFLAGRTNKLLRDFMGAGLAIVFVSMGAFLAINTMVESIRESRGMISLPPKVTRAPEAQENRITSITRSVLDDNLTTSSIGNRPIILDPCTGKEKK